MHIAVDARMYGVAQRGIGRYLMKLIERLERVDQKNTYTIFLRRVNFDEYEPRNQNFTKVLWDAPWYGLREQLQFQPLNTVNCELKTKNCVYHFPHWNVPLFSKRPFVVTIHDLELFSSNRTREASTRGRLTYWLKFQAFKIIFRHAVLAARAIIVPSNCVKEQLLDLYPQVRSKVQVIYEAPTLVNSSQTTVHSESKHAVNRELTTENFVLYVGAAYPHKNLARLLEAWEAVHKDLLEHKLVLVGREDFFWKKIKTQWKQSVISTKRAEQARGEISRAAPNEDMRSLDLARDDELRIVFYGEASDAELAALYKNASLLIQPSLEEGFSLPPLEALSFGCPVAVSDIPVHHEILDDAALFFDPHDARAIAEAIKETLTNPRTRDRILHKAKSQLLRYSWRTAARETLQIYESM